MVGVEIETRGLALQCILKKKWNQPVYELKLGNREMKEKKTMRNAFFF